ncbi:hypothetical protein KC19_N006000 [Ceratodon purpureus]|nr:hypothetical protein KC19_N006000 [Ceratodon purpureus]
MSSKCQLKVVPRKPIPNWIDSITKKWKYVDPGHRYCVPGFKAASFTPKNKAEKYNGRTHNCYAAVTTNNGDRYSFMHPHRKTGFKAGNAYGKTPLFDGLTTKNYFDHLVRRWVKRWTSCPRSYVRTM